MNYITLLISVILLILVVIDNTVPEYSMIYKQAVKDTLEHQNKGRVSCELVVHDVREGKTEKENNE